jgi:hypothetical protein
MRLLYIFTAIFALGYLFTESWAVKPEPVNEMDALMKKIQQNTQAVGQATKQAHQVSEALVEEKAEEKAKLVEAVVVAEAQVVALEQVQEVFVAKMITAGIDTAMVVDEGKNAGPIFDAFLEYQKNGGTEDFNWFRLYIYK